MKFLLPAAILSLFCCLPVSESRAEVKSATDSATENGTKSGTPQVPDYIRFVEAAEGPDLLQTSIVKFRRGPEEVDLVAVVHLGDAAYYEKLNYSLEFYDIVLYEMVGGEHRPKGAGAAATETPVDGIRQLQQMAKSFLGLEFQLEGIDYDAENFVHADIDWELYQQLMNAKNQSMATIFTRAMSLSESGDIPGLPSGEDGIQLVLGNLMTAISSGDSNGLKRTIAPMLSEAEGFISLLEGEDGTVLVTERNKVVMRKLDASRTGRTKGKYAIFYGAGHMPDLEQRLLADGFQRIEESWVDAWTIPASAAGNSAVGDSQFSPADMILKMLQENPEFMNMINQLGDTIEKMQEVK